jgi:hypothetical protein
MSRNSARGPDGLGAAGAGAIETLVIPRPRDIGGFEVRRALPSGERKMMDPVIFSD